MNMPKSSSPTVSPLEAVESVERHGNNSGDLPSKHHSPPLCSYCQNITSNWDHQAKGSPDLPHHNSFLALQKRAETCRLCALFLLDERGCAGLEFLDQDESKWGKTRVVVSQDSELDDGDDIPEFEIALLFSLPPGSLELSRELDVNAVPAQAEVVCKTLEIS
jgi:hypothetical protein